jgi:hypothetical protein
MGATMGIRANTVTFIESVKMGHAKDNKVIISVIMMGDSLDEIPAATERGRLKAIALHVEDQERAAVDIVCEVPVTTEGDRFEAIATQVEDQELGAVDIVCEVPVTTEGDRLVVIALQVEDQELGAVDTVREVLSY